MRLKESADPAAEASRMGLVLWGVAAPLILLALFTLTGLGLDRGLSGVTAVLGATALTGLPGIGLGRLLGAGRGTLALPCLAWAALVLMVFPAYFPGERAGLTRRGASALTRPLGPEASEALGALAARTAGFFGRDRLATAEATPDFPGPGTPPPIARPPEPAPTAAVATAQDRREPAPRPKKILLPYEGEQTSLRVKLDFDGPEVGEPLEMIFDTGATFTTLDRASLAKLGVEIDSTAPWITLRTANGIIEAPLVLIDAVWLGDEPVEWITVAVCDSCANPPISGLLGLNVAKQFQVALDHDRQRIELTPRRRGADRSLDVSRWLEIRSRATRDWTGAVEVALTASNRSRRLVSETVVDLSCGAETFAIQIDDIPPLGERTTQIDLPRGTDCSQQALEVSRASWHLDRF